MTSRENKNTSTGGWPQHDFADSMWADVLNTLGMTKTSKNHVRKKVSRVVVVVERPLKRVNVREPEWAVESQRVRQREPESELQGLKVSLRVTLGPNLGCQSQPRQSELENIDFP